MIIGLILGSLLGQVLKPYLPFLAIGQSLELQPRPFSIADVFSLTFGFSIRFDLATLIGIIIAFFIYRRLD